MIEDFKMGIYQHYKGFLYQVIGLAHDANDETRTCVVYIGLELDGAHLGPRLAVRTLEDFADIVPDNVALKLGFGEMPRNRFTYLGPVLTKEMLT